MSSNLSSRLSRLFISLLGVMLLGWLLTAALHTPIPITAAPAATILAGQDFNSLDDSGTSNADELPSGGQLTNSGASNNGGPGLDFTTYWIDTRGTGDGPKDGGEGGDFIGVNSYNSTDAPDVAPDGTAVASGSEHNFQFNDGDGRLDLVFEPVNLSGYSSRELSFNYWINDDTYESPDQFYFSLSDGSNSQTYLNYNSTQLNSNASADNGSANWLTATVNLEALLGGGWGEVLTLTISVDTNSGSENVFIDNIAFTHDGPFVADPPLINEFVANHAGSDMYEFVEIAGSPNYTYITHTLLVVAGDIEGNPGLINAVFPLTSTTNSGGYWTTPYQSDVLGNGTLNLLLVGNFTGAVGSDIDADNDGVIDNVVWTAVIDSIAVSDGGASDHTYAAATFPPNYDGDIFTVGGASRIPDQTDTDTIQDWLENNFDGEGLPGLSGTVASGEAYNTPGATNQANIPAPGCGDPATLIHTIQGSGGVSPEMGNVHTIEGIVVGDFQGTTGLRGFFVQEDAPDDDAATSEGIFVFDGNSPAVTVAVGDVVRVTGTVAEYNELTELTSVSAVLVCSSGNPLPPPELVTLPETIDGDLEVVEGMLIEIVNEMTVAQTYFLNQYGQMTLSANGRLYQPTAWFSPTNNFYTATVKANARRTLILDDGFHFDTCGDDPDPIPYLGSPPPAVIRAGDVVTNLIGVIDYGQINFGQACSNFATDYRLQPTQPPGFSNQNRRTPTPPDVGGRLTAVGFNVLNYFNGPSFPTPRGADTPSEFTRQRDKIITAVLAINPDIVGLMELENDYESGAGSAIADLVSGLNAATSPGAYAYINPEDTNIGGDAIAVGIIYNTTTVTPTGDYAILDDSFDADYRDHRNRPALAQTFLENSSGEAFTVVVNHFKSKGSSCASDGDPDDPIQGNCNGTRTLAAAVEVDWLATDPTSSGDPDFLVLGDLNFYAAEDPMAEFAAGGFGNALRYFAGPETYSFIFDGQSGYLDHALANDSLLPQISGVVDWHINGDEPSAIDYNTDWNPAGYYSPTVYRASDHDPVIVGLNLGGTLTHFHSIQSGLWTGANWDVAGIPDASGVVTVTSGTTITIDTAVVARAVTIEAGGTLQISASGALTVEGAFHNAGTLLVAKTAVPVTQTTSFGRIYNSNGTAVKYGGVAVTPDNSVLGATTVAIRHGDADCHVGSPADAVVNSCYTIMPTTSGTADLRLGYDELNRNGQDADGMRGWEFDGYFWEPNPVGSSTGYSEISDACLSYAGERCWVGLTAVALTTNTHIALGDAPPTPLAPFLILTGTLVSSDTAQFNWSATAYPDYQLWRSSLPYIGYTAYKNVNGATSTLETDGVADPVHNYFYEVYLYLDGQARGSSTRVGVFTFGVTPGD